MKAIVRKNGEAVSPVIATILMVAITVVLAAVMYVMVSGLISAPSTSKQLGVAVSKSSDGTNWILLFTSAPAGFSQGQTYFSMTTSSGASTNVTAATLSSLTALPTAAPGAEYIPVTNSGTPSATGAVSANDRVLVNALWWPTGTQFSFTSGGSLIASGTLQ